MRLLPGFEFYVFLFLAIRGRPEMAEDVLQRNGFGELDREVLQNDLIPYGIHELGQLFLDIDSGPLVIQQGELEAFGFAMRKI